MKIAIPRYRINQKLLLMKVNYFFGTGGFAPFTPFLATIAKQWGYSAFVVGFMSMLQPIPGLLVRPIFGAITDKYKCRRSVFVTSTVFIFLLVCLLLIIPEKTSDIQLDDLDVIKSPLFWLFFSAVSLINAASMVKGVLDDTICMNLLGDETHKYGKQRLWGSIGSSLMGIVSGVCVDWYSKGQKFKNYAPAFIISLVCFVVDIFVVWKTEVIQQTDTKVVFSDLKKVFCKVKVLMFLLWVVIFGFFRSLVWKFAFWYLEDLSDVYHPEIKSWMKTLQGLSLIVRYLGGEGLSFFLSSYILKRVDHMTVFSLMFFMYAAVFSAYSVIRNPLWTLPLEILNGTTFGMLYSAGISYAALVAPAGAEGTLQGVVGMALYGIGSPIGSFVAGYMFKRFGSIESFRLMGLIALVTCIAQIVVNRLIVRFSRNKDTVEESTTRD